MMMFCVPIGPTPTKKSELVGLQWYGDECQGSEQPAKCAAALVCATLIVIQSTDFIKAGDRRYRVNRPDYASN